MCRSVDLSLVSQHPVGHCLGSEWSPEFSKSYIILSERPLFFISIFSLPFFLSFFFSFVLPKQAKVSLDTQCRHVLAKQLEVNFVCQTQKAYWEFGSM